MKTRQAYYRTKLEHQANYAVANLPLTVIIGGKEYFYTHFVESSYRYDYSLVYVLNGALNFTSDGKKFTVNKGSFALIEPQKHLNFTSHKEYNSYFWLQFSGFDAKKTVEQFKLSFEKEYNIGVHEEISEHFSKIFKEFLINDDFFDTAVAAKLIELLTALARMANSTEKFSLNSIEYIHKHYNEELTVEFLASLENLSCSHYREVFKNTVGTTPYDYIISLRINAACFYLSGNTYTVNEIAEIVGYADRFYFSRIFKKKMGVSPLKYRHQNTLSDI